MARRHKPQRDTSRLPAWEQPPPPEVLALIERFPAAPGKVLAFRHAMLFAVSGIALWGILARGWTATPLLAYFGAELALVMLLNFACIAVLPVALTEQDRGIVKGWAWFASVALVVALAYGSVEGFAGMRDAIVEGAGALRDWLVRERLAWPLVAMVGVHLVDLAADIAFWRARGGKFHYWAGISFLFRMFFCLAFGLFLGFFAWLSTQGMDAARRWAFIVWLVFLGADLFATWVPIWLTRAAQRSPQRPLARVR